MRRIFLILMIIPSFVFSQRTFIPDDAFEQALINLDLDDMLDDSVNTATIDTVQVLYIPNEGIIDMTGIEDFTSLTILSCFGNQLTTLDVTNNTALENLNCGDNQLT